MQIDFTEGRLAVKIDPSGKLLHSFIDLNNMALSRFSPEDRKRLGVHTCPGSDRDSTHSGDVDYAELLPSLFELNLCNFYIALAGEQDRVRVLQIIRKHLKPGQRVFVGVVAPIDPRVETPEEVCEQVQVAAQYIPVDNWGPRTIADSRRSAMTPRQAAKQHLKKSARVYSVRHLPRKQSEAGDVTN